MSQKITSADTSIRQVGAFVKLVHELWGWQGGTINLDLGGGRYYDTTEALAKHFVANAVIDPYNRLAAHNEAWRYFLQARGGADTCSLSNVLNVIREPAARQEVLWEAWDLTKSNGMLYITVHEGDRSSRGRRTAKGWQANRPLKNYLAEVRKVWPGAERYGQLIVATKED